MTGRFLRRRSFAREQAARAVDVGAEQIARLVALATTLADRTEAMPSAGLDRDRERKAHVDVLRQAAQAGRQTLDAQSHDVPSDDQDGQQTARG